MSWNRKDLAISREPLPPSASAYLITSAGHRLGKGAGSFSMDRPFHLSRSAAAAAATFALIFFVSCEAPALKDTEAQNNTEPETAEPAPSSTADADTALNAGVSGDPAPHEAPTALHAAPRTTDPGKEAADLLSGDGLRRELPPGDELEPVLRVYRNEEGAIVVEGAIRSRFQRDEIVQLLGEAFSGTRIEDRLELDYDRIPVGWGNRVALQFLVPFFKVIEDGFFEYEMGIITMAGKGSLRHSDYFQHLAIDVFSDPHSRDIINQIGE